MSVKCTSPTIYVWEYVRIHEAHTDAHARPDILWLKMVDLVR